MLREPAGLAWAINLGCVDLNPHPVRSGDLDHPDELRIDLDPMPGVEWPQILEVAQVAREVLEDHGLTAWPKTSGSRGFHIYARIAPQWPFKQVRLAAETVAREVQRRAPDLASSQWWKEERGQRIFVDFNQNAKDRTVASAYSVRATPPGRAGVDAADMGRGPPRLPGRGVHDPDCPGPLRRARRSVGVDGRRRRLAGCTAAAGRGTRACRETTERQQAADRGRPHQDPRRGSGGLDVWRARHPEAAKTLQPNDILVDGMRGPSSIWYRIRINLEHVPEEQRPAQEELIADYSPWEGYSGGRQGRP